MGRKMESAVIPYNDYVLDLGAHEPPAPPEKELAEMRGMWQTFLAAAIGIFIWFFFLDPNYGWLHWGLNGASSNESSVETTSPVSTEPVSAETTAPAEEPEKVWMTLWVGDDELVAGGFINNVRSGDVIEVMAYSAEAKIKRITYTFDFFGELMDINDNEGSIILPEYPKGAWLHLFIGAEDTDGNFVPLTEYVFLYR